MTQDYLIPAPEWEELQGLRGWSTALQRKNHFLLTRPPVTPVK